MLIVPSVPAQEAHHGPSIQWEEAPCPMCLSRHWTPLIEAQDPHAGAEGLWFVVVQCDSCGACFTNPRPEAGTMGQFYDADYQPHAKRPARRRRWSPWRIFGKKPRVEKRPVPWHGTGRLLDFGCGNGQYLHLMHEHGWNVTGLDMSVRAVERIRDELGLAAYTGTLPHHELGPGSFDVITMWHSLEHVHDPAAVLREARALLAPGGKVYVATPNIDSLPYRWFGKDWFGLDLPRHLVHFTPTTLLQILQRAGFATEPIQFVRHADWIRASARRAMSNPDLPIWQSWLRFTLPAAVASWYVGLQGQSDVILAIGHK